MTQVVNTRPEAASALPSAGWKADGTGSLGAIMGSTNALVSRVAGSGLIPTLVFSR
jgi:hypothetical protein